ncbi:MAG: Hint domain-containing protein [Boseongicola sp.]
MSVQEESTRGPIEEGITRVLSRIRLGEETSENFEENESPVSDEDPITSPDESECEDRWPLPGLAPMTRVRTSFGDVHAIALRDGDLVKTRSGDFKPIVWLNRVLLDEQFLAEKNDSNPIRIQAGAMGPATPSSDVLVSPRQIVCPTPKSSLSERREAADLLAKPGVMRIRETGLSYTMFHLGEPAEIQCDGMFLLLSPPEE